METNIILYVERKLKNILNKIKHTVIYFKYPLKNFMGNFKPEKINAVILTTLKTKTPQ